MRPAGKGPLDSLYFHYPIFPVGNAPEREGRGTRHPVVVAGAGPIGMETCTSGCRYEGERP